MKEFKIGDEVEFEMGKPGYARWNEGIDYGGTGKWMSDIISNIDSYGEITVQTESYSWIWPSVSVYSKLYENSGYLRHKQKQIKYKLIDMGGYFCTQEIT